MPAPGCALPGTRPAARPLLLGLPTGVISSGPLEERGCSYTLINNQPKLFGPVSMGTAARFRLIFDVVSVDNKRDEDAAEQAPRLRLRGQGRLSGCFPPRCCCECEGRVWSWRGSRQHVLSLHFHSHSRASAVTNRGRVLI